MSYVFDTNAFSQLSGSCYRGRFPTLWEQFDELVANGRITSTRKIRREIEQHSVEALRNWVNYNRKRFLRRQAGCWHRRSTGYHAIPTI